MPSTFVCRRPSLPFASELLLGGAFVTFAVGKFAQASPPEGRALALLAAVAGAAAIASATRRWLRGGAILVGSWSRVVVSLGSGRTDLIGRMTLTPRHALIFRAHAKSGRFWPVPLAIVAVAQSARGDPEYEVFCEAHPLPPWMQGKRAWRGFSILDPPPGDYDIGVRLRGSEPDVRIELSWCLTLLPGNRAVMQGAHFVDDPSAR